jgi:hypothetical protein
VARVVVYSCSACGDERRTVSYLLDVVEDLIQLLLHLEQLLAAASIKEENYVSQLT